MKTKFVQLASAEIAYTEYGSGPNLILLHGNSQSKSVFRKHQLRHFNCFHTYAIDSRGHGQSVSKDDTYSIQQYSQDIIEFCKKLGIQKTHVAGFSDGGNICLLLARDNPGIFDKIIALSPNYLASGSTDSTLRFLNTMYRVFVFLRKIHFLPHRKLAVWELMLKDIGITESELSGIRANLFILYAEDDMIKEEHILKMAQLIPQCQLMKVAKSTHLNMCNKDDTINAIMKYIGG